MRERHEVLVILILALSLDFILDHEIIAVLFHLAHHDQDVLLWEGSSSDEGLGLGSSHRTRQRKG